MVEGGYRSQTAVETIKAHMMVLTSRSPGVTTRSGRSMAKASTQNDEIVTVNRCSPGLRAVPTPHRGEIDATEAREALPDEGPIHPP